MVSLLFVHFLVTSQLKQFLLPRMQQSNMIELPIKHRIDQLSFLPQSDLIKIVRRSPIVVIIFKHIHGIKRHFLKKVQRMGSTSSLTIFSPKYAIKKRQNSRKLYMPFKYIHIVRCKYLHICLQICFAAPPQHLSE